MLTSKNGKEEHTAKNNHGAWYLVQSVDFALFTGDTGKARELAGEGRARIDAQVEKDGKMPLELARTNGLWYSTYTLQAWFKLCTLAELTGIDLWNYRNKDGAGVRTALDWLEPYALGQKKWDYQQISEYDRGAFFALLLQAAAKYKEHRYVEDARVAGEKENTMMAALLYGE
jgi:hypothetical protein